MFNIVLMLNINGGFGEFDEFKHQPSFLLRGALISVISFSGLEC